MDDKELLRNNTIAMVDLRLNLIMKDEYPEGFKTTKKALTAITEKMKELFSLMLEGDTTIESRSKRLKTTVDLAALLLLLSMEL